MYRNFPVVVSERWQQEISETVFDTINQETDKIEQKRKAKLKCRFEDEKESDCKLHGYLKKLGGLGGFASNWQTRYGKLYPNRLELHSESANTKPELIFMDTIEEVSPDYVQVKGENCIVLKSKNEPNKDAKLVLTNPDEIGLKEWLCQLKSTHKDSVELLGSMAKKATKIYGAENRSTASNITSGFTTSSSQAHHTSNVLSNYNSN